MTNEEKLKQLSKLAAKLFPDTHHVIAINVENSEANIIATMEQEELKHILKQILFTIEEI